MPTAAPKPCTRCGAVVRDGTSRCEAHKVLVGSFADSRRGTRQQRGYGRQWEQARKRVLRRDKGLCQPCMATGRATPAREVDHRVPKFEGGVDDDDNLQAICKPCHAAKTAAEAARARGIVGDAATGRPGPAAGVAPRQAAAGGRGVHKSAAPGDRTDRLVTFLRAQDRGVGGVSKVGGS